MRCAIKTYKHNIIVMDDSINKTDSLVVKVHVDEYFAAYIVCDNGHKRKYQLPSFPSKYSTVFVLLDISVSK